ncbi:hypothetical protein ACQPZX_38600 [Actinoplanes sp. CA-142083]|uniref:hypothetical protein n=1 Tax=Actinoplanes sp. CA-142083 TaxID=3239903 RepID=UPI003D8E6EB4
MDWKLTRNAIGEPAIDQIRDDPEEDLTLGWSLLHTLTQLDESAREITPGIYCFSKSSTEKML